MATYYAQGDGVIDEVEWDTSAGGGGTDLVWANLDPADILVANGKAITIDLSFTCAKISTLAYSGTVGGSFTVTAACTVTADLEYGSAGGETCLTTSGAGYAFTLTGDVLASTGGVANKYGLSIVSALTAVTINGDVTGGAGTANHGVNCTSGTPITINGSVTSGTGSTARGVYTNGPVEVNNGTVSGIGSGNTSSTAIYSYHASGTTLNNCNLVYGTVSSPILGALFYHPGATNYIQIPKTTGGAGTYKYGKTIPAADVQSGVDGDGANAPATGTFTAPAEADVKDGVKYGGGGTEYEGTLVAGGGGGMGGHGMSGGIPA